MNSAAVATERKMPELRDKVAKAAPREDYGNAPRNGPVGPAIPTAESLKEKLKTPPVLTKDGDLF